MKLLVNFPEVILHYIIEKPIKSKIIICILGTIFGCFIPFYMKDARFVLPLRFLLVAIPFWTFGMAIFLTIFRSISLRSDRYSLRQYDVREFFKLTLYYFIPHGLASLIVFLIINEHRNGLGVFAIAGGVSFYLGAMISQKLKK